MEATITEHQTSCKRHNGVIRYNIIKCGRKVIAEIWHPSPFTDFKYDVSVKVAPGYVLKSLTDDFPTALEEFDRLTDGKYQFN